MGIASGIEIERVRYEQLLERSRTRSVFAESWWLDAATGTPDAWTPNLLLDANGDARAAWPMVTRSTARGVVGTGAPYTPWLGPQLPERAGTIANRTSADVELLRELARLLAGHAHVEAACLPELDYWTPLSWHGFEQTTRTTWRIEAATAAVDLRGGMRKKTRAALVAAERDGLVARPGTVEELLLACDATFAHQGAAGAPARDALERLARAAIARDRGEVLAVDAPDGQLASAGLFVRDDRRAYNLANGRIATADASGAPTVLLTAAIERALDRGLGFDFEGSMLEPVEHFVRGFGGAPVGYSVVRRSSPGWSRAVARKRRLKRLLRRP
jgi:hypothetical protein